VENILHDQQLMLVCVAIEL